MMAIQPLAQLLDQVSEKIKGLQDKYTNVAIHKDLPEDIKQLIPILEDCNQSLTAKENLKNKDVFEDPEINSGLIKLVNTIMNFPPLQLGYDKSTQEKVNALQAGLFPTFMHQITELRNNLRKWRIGERVEKSNSSQTNERQE